MTVWLTFPWQDGQAALAVSEVQAVLDDPVYGSSPWPEGPWRRLLAWRGELCPVIEDPGLAAEPGPREAALVLVHHEGALALRIAAPPRLVEGTAGAGILETDAGPLPVWTRTALLERWIRSEA